MGPGICIKKLKKKSWYHHKKKGGKEEDFATDITVARKTYYHVCKELDLSSANHFIDQYWDLEQKPHSFVLFCFSHCSLIHAIQQSSPRMSPDLSHRGSEELHGLAMFSRTGDLPGHTRLSGNICSPGMVDIVVVVFWFVLFFFWLLLTSSGFHFSCEVPKLSNNCNT